MKIDSKKRLGYIEKEIYKEKKKERERERMRERKWKI